MAGRLIDRMRACRLGHTRFYFIPEIIAFFIVAPIVFMVVDRTPPLVLYDGSLVPNIVYPGQRDVTVQWRAHFSGRDCPGITQREVVDSKNNLWPKSARSRRGIFIPDWEGASEGSVHTPPLDIPPQIEAGSAYYRVTQLYYCNALQRWIDWPIVQVSPRVPFQVSAP